VTQPVEPPTGPPIAPEPTGTVAAPAPAPARSATPIRVLGIVVIVAGAIVIVAGVVTWFAVKSQLSDEKITVSADADHFGGDSVDGPLTAYAEADAIEGHALEASGGKTYAQLPKDDPTRETVMTASFLRASLFTSVVAFGVAFMAAGLGIVLILIGVAIVLMASRFAAPRSAPPPAMAATAV
jgi:hypothetical protein